MFAVKLIASTAARAFIGAAIAQLVKKGMETYFEQREVKLRDDILRHIDEQIELEEQEEARRQSM